MPYHQHLSKDKILRELIKKHGQPSVEKEKHVYLHICASIISQQLSTKVAAVIYARFLQLFGKKVPRPAAIMAMPHEQLRSIGLSNSKAVYIKNVCSFFMDNSITDARLYKMSNDELVTLLTQIKGVGRWTVEMILMFTLGREDVFSAGDLGLQKAMIRLYNIEYSNQKELVEKMMIIADKWSPYRSYACKYLWKHLDAPLVPV